MTMPDDARAATRELQHAPGPWYVKREVDGVPFDRYTRVFAVDSDGVHHQVASTYNQTRARLQYDLDTAEANASLISKAWLIPELLAVVKRTLSLFEAMAVDVDECARIRELVERAEGK